MANEEGDATPKVPTTVKGLASWMTGQVGTLAQAMETHQEWMRTTLAEMQSAVRGVQTAQEALQAKQRELGDELSRVAASMRTAVTEQVEAAVATLVERHDDNARSTRACMEAVNRYAGAVESLEQRGPGSVRAMVASDDDERGASDSGSDDEGDESTPMRASEEGAAGDEAGAVERKDGESSPSTVATNGVGKEGTVVVETHHDKLAQLQDRDAVTQFLRKLFHGRERVTVAEVQARVDPSCYAQFDEKTFVLRSSDEPVTIKQVVDALCGVQLTRREMKERLRDVSAPKVATFDDWSRELCALVTEYHRRFRKWPGVAGEVEADTQDGLIAKLLTCFSRWGVEAEHLDRVRRNEAKRREKKAQNMAVTLRECKEAMVASERRRGHQRGMLKWQRPHGARVAATSTPGAEGASRHTPLVVDGYEGVKCYACNKRGHMAKHCREDNRRCYNCGTVGHISMYCPQRPRGPSRKGGQAHVGGIQARSRRLEDMLERLERALQGVQVERDAVAATQTSDHMREARAASRGPGEPVAAVGSAIMQQ